MDSFLLVLLPLLLYSLALYASWRDLRWGLFMVVVAMPLNNRLMFDLYIPQLLPVRMVLVALFLVAGVRLYEFFMRVGVSEFLSSAKELVAKDVILFTLLSLLAVRVASLYHIITFRSSLSFLGFFVAMVLLYLVLRVVLRNHGREFILDLWNVHAVTVVGTSLYSFVQLFFIEMDRVLPGVWPSITEPTRFGATFWDINHYAPYVGSVIPYFLLKTIYAKETRSRLLYAGGFVLTNLAMGMTLSRSGWLGYAFALMVLGVVLLVNRMWRGVAGYSLTMVLMIIALVIGIMTFDLPIVKRLNSLSTRVYNESFEAHRLLNSGHFEIFSRYPVLGGGYGSFSDRFRETPQSLEYFEIDPVEEVRLPAHSVWLEILSETGFMGMIVFVTFITLIFRGLHRAARQVAGSEIALLSVALSAAVAGMLFSGLFYHYNLEFFWMVLFFAVFIPRVVLKEGTYDAWHYLALFTLVGVGTAVIFPYLGRNALIDWDESIYAQVSKNIVRFRDPFTLRWHLEKFWFEKPPLYFWLTSITYLVHEISEFSARFWSAVSGVGGAVMVYFFGKELFGKAMGVVSALTLLSTVHWVFQSRNGTLDVLAAVMILITLYFFWRARTHTKEWLWVGTFLGFTLMSKGAVVAVPLAIMGVYGLLEWFLYNTRSHYPLKKMSWRLAVPFVLVVGPWHLALWFLHGQSFIDSYVIYHVLERSTTGIEDHGNDFWWFVVVMKVWARHNFLLLLTALSFLMWTWIGTDSPHTLANVTSRNRYTREVLIAVLTFVLSAFLFFSFPAPVSYAVVFGFLVIVVAAIRVFVIPVRGSAQYQQWLPDPRQLFLFVWFVLTFLIFSFSASKIQWYIIPIYPVVSLLIGWLVIELLGRFKVIKWQMLVIIIFLLSVPFFREQYRPMWDLDDVWRGVAEVVPHLTYESRKIKDPELYIIDMSPGPAMFYSEHPTITGNYTSLVNAAEGEHAFFAVAKIGTAKRLVDDYGDSHEVKIFKQYEDDALVGRW